MYATQENTLLWTSELSKKSRTSNDFRLIFLVHVGQQKCHSKWENLLAHVQKENNGKHSVSQFHQSPFVQSRGTTFYCLHTYICTHARSDWPGIHIGKCVHIYLHIPFCSGNDWNTKHVHEYIPIDFLLRPCRPGLRSLFGLSCQASGSHSEQILRKGHFHRTSNADILAY